MGKRKEETKDEKRERKRLKKEAKRQSQSFEKTSPTIVVTESHDNHEIPIFFRKRLELTVSLLPSALSDVQMNIEDSLRAFLLKYSDGINGILLAFDQVELLGKGTIFNELPHIHYKVSTDAVVFSPSNGSQLNGVVSEASFQSHLSLTVLNYFNASIAAQEMNQAGFTFEEESWKYHGRSLQKGDAVTFICQKMYESGGIISIAGSQPCVP